MGYGNGKPRRKPAASSCAVQRLRLTMTDQARRVADCHLLLRGTRWMPVSVNKKLGAIDRCSPNGAVISAYLSAVVEGDRIVGW